MEFILDSKIQIKYVNTKKQLADILTKGKLHTWWMESSFVFVQHWPFQFGTVFRSPVEKKWTESQQNWSRWWIRPLDAAKGLLTCYLLLHQKAQRKPDMNINFLWARKLSSIKKTERPVANAHPSSFSEWNVDKTWSSQEWRSDELMEDRLKSIRWIFTPKQNQNCR